jgi:hypothetical protein
MNKHDIKLIVIILIIVLLSFILLKITSKDSKTASVYYKDNLLLTIDLTINKEYIVSGYNGNVVIEVKKGKIKVKEETSPLHICSKQGWVDSVYEPIICLPNKIVIKLNSKNDLDAIVK